MRFTQPDYSEYYHKQMVEAGYPGMLLDFAMKELEGFVSVIDIGAGTGFFSVPLAVSGHSVTAVEPSAGMIDVMKKNCPSDIISSIKICHMPWESWSGERHDAALSVHSLYPMGDIKAAISMINGSAIKKILIVRDSSGMKTLSGLMRERLGILSNRDLNMEITSILDELRVNWKLVNINEQRRHIITDFRQEADSLIFQLKLDNGFRGEIIDILEKVTVRESDFCFFNANYSDNAYIF